MRYWRYYIYIRRANPHLTAKRVLEYIKIVEKAHGLNVLSK